MKKYFTTVVMAMVMMVTLAMPVYAGGYRPSDRSHHNDNVIIKNNRGTTTQGDGNIIGNETDIKIKDNNVILGDGVIVDGNIKGNFNEGTVIGGNVSAEGGEGGNATNGGNTQEVNIENPDKIRVATHLSSPGQLSMDSTEYHGKVYIDHKFQKEILDFFLSKPGLKPYVVKKQGFFTRKSAHSRSGSVSTKKYAEQSKVYAFKSMAELKKSGLKYEVVGYTDTFSEGKATLMGCFDQSVIDAGVQGANGLAVIKYDYMTAIDSTTTGLGGSGATGAIKGGVSSVYGAAIGYANSKATPETNPYVYGITVYIPELDSQVINDASKEIKPDRFKTRDE